MSRIYIRCSRETCRLRYTVKLEPLNFKCRKCGNEKYRLDKTAMARDNAKMSCLCTGYKWGDDRTSKAPHRKGSRQCHYRKDGTQRFPGDPDYWFETLEEEEWYEAQHRSNASGGEDGSSGSSEPDSGTDERDAQAGG